MGLVIEYISLSADLFMFPCTNYISKCLLPLWAATYPTMVQLRLYSLIYPLQC